MLIIKPIMLEGNYVLLRPPLTTDVFGLSQAAKDGEIWNNPYALFPHENDISAYLQVLLKESNSFLPFIIVDKRSDTIVGSTRYLNIDYDNYHMEIGHTWVAKSFRRTAVNTEMKFLMLQYAFEKLKCIAIEMRTDVLNVISRKAIERLGAKEDGILRNHKIMRNGRKRDTVCYSGFSGMSAPEVTGEIEPLVDITTTDSEVKVVVEMPGTSKDKIKINAYDNTVEVRSEDPQRKYHRTIEIPPETDIETATSSYNNGILEITFKKKDRTKGRTIKVE